MVQELLQGFPRPSAAQAITERFAAVDLVVPTIADHIEAAEISNRCRRGGVQLKTVDALLAALCIRDGLTMLTADGDFAHVARFTLLEVWRPAA